MTALISLHDGNFSAPLSSHRTLVVYAVWPWLKQLHIIIYQCCSSPLLKTKNLLLVTEERKGRKDYWVVASWAGKGKIRGQGSTSVPCLYLQLLPHLASASLGAELRSLFTFLSPSRLYCPPAVVCMLSGWKGGGEGSFSFFQLLSKIALLAP